ncbi:MAG: GNAT family N-acetyltransferase [Planctomycetes bacterium]|nr:GNAT family N-acetyltransferase [Planctomycetota bacterium]
MTTTHIRSYQPGDQAAAYHVCMKTGDHGADGEPFYQEDPDALGRIYVGPYFAFEPDFALILEDEKGVCGYALAAFDTRQFFDRYEKEWRPRLCQDFPMPGGDSNSWSRVEQVYYHYHHPSYFSPEPYQDYPSHLHIDLLARTRGQGLGRRMIETLLERLQLRGSPGVHLELSAVNERAYGFYAALGFQELSRRGVDEKGSICMGIKFG